MDDKVFIFVLLIPGILIGVSYYFMRETRKSKLTFVILISILIIGNLVVYIGLEPKSKWDISSGIRWLIFTYGELLFLFFFCLIYGFTTLHKNNNP